jgi:modification methylase
MAQGLEACNGWAFWHVETAKGLTSIDDFRAQVRAEMAEAAE